MDPLSASLKIAGSALEAESSRLRVVSQNMANANSTSSVSGGDPYNRQTISFRSIISQGSDVGGVVVDRIRGDDSAFIQKFEPGHPAADEAGYVKYPNVNPIIEMADMREANRSYQANLEVFKQARELITMTIDLMRSR